MALIVFVIAAIGGITVLTIKFARHAGPIS